MLYKVFSFVRNHTSQSMKHQSSRTYKSNLGKTAKSPVKHHLPRFVEVNRTANRELLSY